MEPPKPKAANPFAKKAANPFAKKAAAPVWPPGEKKAEYDAVFATYGPDGDNKLDGEKAVEALQATELDQDNLFKARFLWLWDRHHSPERVLSPAHHPPLTTRPCRCGNWQHTAVMEC